MKLNETQIYKRILDFETEENITMFNSAYGNLWPIFKMHISRALQLERGNIKKRTSFYRILIKLKAHLSAIKNQQFNRFIKLKNDFEKDEIWFSNHELRYENHKKHNKYIDPFFIELSSDNSIMYEATSKYPSEFTFPHLKGKIIKNLNPILLNYNNKYLLKKSITFFNSEYSKFKKTSYAKLLLKHFHDCNIYSLFLEYNYFVDYYKFYTFFFNKYPNIKKTYIVAYYMTSRMAMIAVANKNNIKTIDIQHNVMTKTHFAYGAWNFVPKGGYCLLPKWFYVFSEKEVTFLNKVFKKQHRLKIVKNYTYEYWKSKKKIKNNDQKDIILISLQNTVITEDSFLLKALLKINRKRNDIKIVFRLHPRHTYIKKDTEFVLNKIKLVFLWDTNPEIYDTLVNTIVNITSFSSVVNDALLLNIPSIIYTEKGILAYENEIKNNSLVKSALNIKNILEIINKYI